jgi:hypothetical protein
MTWAQCLERVLSIGVTTCALCGAVRIVASIEEPTGIRAILARFGKHGALDNRTTGRQRAPPADAA